MIVGIVGKPGSGKSLLLATLAVESLLEGRDVYTNFNLRWLNILLYAWRRSGRPWAGWRGARALVPGRWRQVRTYADMGEVAEGRLFFDEAHIWLWSRAWKELPRDVISWWSQSRKHGVDVWWAAQRANSVDAHVRELTAEIIHCRRIFQTRRFVYQREDMESPDRLRRIWGRSLVTLDPELAACYDTREILPPPYDVEQSGNVVARATGPARREGRAPAARPGRSTATTPRPAATGGSAQLEPAVKPLQGAGERNGEGTGLTAGESK